MKEVRKSLTIFNLNFNWSLFNLFFISFYCQLDILFLCIKPILSAWQGSKNPLNIYDYIISFLMLVFIVLETIVDQQTI